MGAARFAFLLLCASSVCNVASTGVDVVRYDEKVTRHYYIKAEEVNWDYAPSGRDLITNQSLADNDDAAVFTVQTSTAIGRTYKKALYFEYTDETFATRIEKPEWLGNLGPIIRAEVGDKIKVTFLNGALSNNYTIHPHGVRYDVADEGASRYDYGGLGASVAPGQNYTYRWGVPERAGPAEADGNAVMWLYHSHYNSVADTYSGLTGPLVVYARGTLRNGLPADVSREYVLVTTVTDENQSNYIDENCEAADAQRSSQSPCAFSFSGLAVICEETDEFTESNLMHSINGYVYGNLAGLETAIGDRVRWLVAAFGTEVDLHTLHWHGETVVHDGHRVDTIQLMPAISQVAYMDPDQEGTFLVHCHVNDHIIAGMLARYSVAPHHAAKEVEEEGDEDARRLRRRQLRGAPNAWRSMGEAQLPAAMAV
ncbi:unnamed protein product [Phaeothamnion confervicola]